ncbi:MAG: UDP-GlcNAc:undecaprenyl-phosphate/decaprenyl-phosphate GlcNAc-phosphate transferase [Candidatus Sumerlaeota bacterium]|nr:UDP-GlcNAc:undecaprenyl-phosphate/decaprenyl-phosphate GlcNAc-phosphate transferase [Candidatus Sumerlaeota bacterium]
MTVIPTLGGEVPLWVLLALACAAGAVLTWLLTPVAGRIAYVIGAIDQVDARRVHTKPTPRLGGLALFTSFALVTLALYFLAPALFAGAGREFLAIILGATIIVVVGIWDDSRGMRPLYKLGAQIVVAVIVFAGGLRLESLTWPFVESGRIALGYWGLPITILWFAGLMNALNIIDGLDGLCAGISGISSLVLAAIIAQFDTSFYAIMPALTAGLCVGFLFHNYHPAKIFLGDTGSLFLGYMLACTTLTTGTKSTAILTLVIPLLCIAVPVMDTALAIVRRTRQGRHPFSADKEHLHHRLLGLGLSQKRVVWILWFLTAYLGLTAFTLEKAGSPALILANAAFLFAGFIIMIENVSFLAHRREEEQKEIQAARESSASEDTTAAQQVLAPTRGT